MLRATDLGHAIKVLRGSRTQEEVAHRAGIVPAAWSLYERGKRMPRQRNFQRIARGLGCSPYELEERTWEIRSRRLSLASGKDDTWDEDLEAEFQAELGRKLGRLSGILEEIVLYAVKR